ncbi:bile acid-CoA:amino acid N-acyltransferase-like [Clavelina lepadiformis]|uniref:bile acid-CoA:amino acid N-acyltransferase-like n=1 Tax=Clavelina lepadiformis TaxID=159417 RepID=UPI004043119D
MKVNILVEPKESMFDTAVDITVVDLLPYQLITLHSCAQSDSKQIFECVAQYVADDQGCINLKRDKSVGGCYVGCQPMGLFWAMKPSLDNQMPNARMAKIHVTTPMVVTITAYHSKINSIQEAAMMRKEGKLKEIELACTTVNRLFMSPGTTRIPLLVEKDGITGTLFIPSGKGPFPGVVTMFGGYPGTMESKASLLASHGFAALALAFYGLPGLPEFQIYQNLELEYFEKAIKLLSEYPAVDFKRGIGVMGLSFSSFIVLTMGERLKDVKCVISINGFHYPMWGTISYKGKVYEKQNFDPKPHQTFSDLFGAQARNLYPKHMDPLHADLEASRIKFYNCHDVAFMLIASLDDKSVPAEYYVNQAEKLFKMSKHPNYRILRYPGAGHLLEPCYGSHHHETYQKLFQSSQVWGGEMIAHCKAQEHAWKKQIDFLKTTLSSSCFSKL